MSAFIGITAFLLVGLCFVSVVGVLVYVSTKANDYLTRRFGDEMAFLIFILGLGALGASGLFILWLVFAK